MFAFPLAIPVAVACGADSITSLSVTEPNEHIAARVGERIDVRLQTIGTGEYGSPPTISSPSVGLLDVTDCGVAVPAGATQCFHFRALARGRAIVTFTHTGDDPQVQDTVDVL